MYIYQLINKIIGYIRIKKLNAKRDATISISKTVRIDRKSRIRAYPGTAILVGNNVYLRSDSEGYHTGMPFPTTLLVDVKGGSINIGDNCRLNGAYIHAQKSISIGKNCLIAAGVNIIDSNGHIVMSGNRTIGRDNPKEIVIGDNVWIGLNSTILKGSILGNNSVISAGSVVKGIFPDNSLIQGNPAQVVSILPIE